MKVEIRFRVWDKVNRRMTFGGSFHTLEIDGKLQEWFGMPTPHPDDCELMQYTGLKDKNGVEGYFDDLVKWGKSIYQVVWDETEGVAWLRRVKGDEVWSKLRIHLIEDGEVIGNIWENKELLEVSP